MHCHVGECLLYSVLNSYMLQQLILERLINIVMGGGGAAQVLIVLFRKLQ